MKEKCMLVGLVVICISVLTWHWMTLKIEASIPTIIMKCNGGLLSWSYDINLVGSFATPEEAKRHGDNVSKLIERDRKK